MTDILAFENLYSQFVEVQKARRIDVQCKVRKHIVDDFTRMEYCKHESRL